MNLCAAVSMMPLLSLPAVADPLPYLCVPIPPPPLQLLDDPLSAVDPRVGRILFDRCISNTGVMAGGKREIGWCNSMHPVWQKDQGC